MEKVEFVSPLPAAPRSNDAATETRDTGQENRRIVEAVADSGGSAQVAPDRESLERALEELGEASQSVRRDLEFQVDDGSGRVVITVLDSESQEVIREIPPEKLLAMAENLSEVRGLLFEDEV